MTDPLRVVKRAARPITLGAIGVSIVLAFIYALRTAVSRAADEFAEAWDKARGREEP